MTATADGADDGADKDSLVAELERRNAELTAALAARDDFLALAAHELRNPMTPIVGYVQRLRRLLRSEACSLREIEQAVERLEWLIALYVKRATTLLDVSRITSGRLRLEVSRIDVGELVRNAASAFEPATQLSGSTLTLAVEQGLVVHADRLALEQILDNLLLNAIKYGAGKPIHVSALSQGETLVLQVRDNGIGLTPEDQERIFQPFERAVAYGTKAGFGIGLWVVRQLVDAMGGAIRLDSSPGAGTLFTVTIPRNVAPLAEKQRAEA